MSDDRKRTVRAQLTNGALEAKAYVGPTGVGAGDDLHKTFRMKKVDVDPDVDPRLRKTVARGMGEAVAAIEGDIVDPETGRVLPPVGADPNPASPWKIGKRPTHVRLPLPELRTAGTTGVARSTASQPSRLAWVAAAVIILAAVVGAVTLAMRARRVAPASTRPATTASPGAAAPAADRQAGSSRAGPDARVEGSAPPTAAPGATVTVQPPVAAPAVAPSAAAPSTSPSMPGPTSSPVRPTPGAAGSPARTPPAGASSPPRSPGGGRIF